MQDEGTGGLNRGERQGSVEGTHKKTSQTLPARWGSSGTLWANPMKRSEITVWSWAAAPCLMYLPQKEEEEVEWRKKGRKASESCRLSAAGGKAQGDSDGRPAAESRERCGAGRRCWSTCDNPNPELLTSARPAGSCFPPLSCSGFSKARVQGSRCRDTTGYTASNQLQTEVRGGKQ